MHMATTPTNSAMGRLIDRLSRLPGIGRRSAERIAFHLLKADPDEAEQLAAAVVDMRRNLRHCSTCYNLAETDPCPICSDPNRDQTRLMVVEQPRDVAMLESSGAYRGLYHVLMGRLAPLEGVGPGDLTIAELIDRVKQGAIEEVILATNPTLEGDGTALYLDQQLSSDNVNVTRLARGLPTGTDLSTVSKAVLADAVHQRLGVPHRGAGSP